MNTHTYKRQLLKDRVKLIRALYSIPGVGADLGRMIAKDTDRFLSVSQDVPGKVSYARNQMDRHRDARRVRLTFPKYVRRCLDLNEFAIGDHVLSSVTEKMSVILWPSTADAFEILRGEDIITAYEEEVGDSSCMTGEDCKGLLDLYEINTQKVGLLVYNKTEGRALLWNCDDGCRLMDRVYPDNRLIRQHFINWCGKNDVRYRMGTGGPHTDRRDENCAYHTVTVKCPEKFPYMDTFHYGEMVGMNKLILYSEEGNGSMTFDSTDGDCTEQQQCCGCRDYVDNGREVEGDWYCDSCFSDQWFTCRNCSARFDISEGISISGHSRLWCRSCADAEWPECCTCHTRGPWYLRSVDEEARHQCDACYQAANPVCAVCGNRSREFTIIENVVRCFRCNGTPAAPIPPTPSDPAIPDEVIFAGYTGCDCEHCRNSFRRRETRRRQEEARLQALEPSPL